MSIEVIDKIKQKNNGKFPLMDAVDVEMSDGSTVEESITRLNTDVKAIEKVTELPANPDPNTLYLIVG